MTAVKNRHQFKLCLVTNAQHLSFSEYKNLIIQVVEGGVTLIQLRDKSKKLSPIRKMALELKALLAPFKVPLIINDYLSLAKEIDADGVHLGQADASPAEARQLLGPDKIIGWSIETLAELELANQSTCLDYVAASAVFPSQTKKDCKTIWGLEGLQHIAKQSKHPVMAIGGIDPNNVASVIAHDACGVAVVSVLHTAKDPKDSADFDNRNQSIFRREKSCLKR